MPATALYFGGYESGKRLMPADYGILGDMLVGCYTQAIAGIVFTPVDIIKERMQVRYCPTCSTLSAVDALEPHMPCCTCCRAHHGLTQTLHLHLSKGLILSWNTCHTIQWTESFTFKSTGSCIALQSMCLTKAVQGKGCQHLVVQPDMECLSCTGARDDASSLQLSQRLPCCCQHRTATRSAWSDEGLLGNQLCLVSMEYDLHCVL